MLGHALVSGNPIVPAHYQFYWQPTPPVCDPQQAREMLKQAGFPNGFDGGEYHCDASYATLSEMIVDNLLAVGIRTRLRPIERAAFIKGLSEKKFKDLIEIGPAAFGNAATRIESFAVKSGIFSYGSYPDIDELYQQQTGERDISKREAMLHRVQQIIIDRAMFAPIWQSAFLSGVGERVGDAAFGTIAGFPYTAPYEDLTLEAG
jgi:peptide/nickel transport system substrate-binding protein